MRLKAASKTKVLNAYLKQTYDYQQLKSKHDIVLSPYISPFSTLSGANWAKDFLHINDYAKQSYPLKKGIVVFILDTAGQITHKDLKAHIDNVHGRDFTGEGLEDGNGHGTACASCYIGPGNGCAPANVVTIVPVKVLRNNGSGSYASVKNGIEYAYEAWQAYYPTHKAIISMSLGGASDYPPISIAIEQVTKKGMYVFASAGNSGYSDTYDKVGFPARALGAIAVGSVSKDGKISSFSSAGPQVQFTGPGSSVLVAWKDDSYITANGTSFSMPYTVAAFCWLVSVHDLKADQALPYFRKFATDLHTTGWDRGTGFGAPMLSRYIGQSPTEEDPKPKPSPEPKPDPTPKPTPDPVEREKRELIFTFKGGFPITWKNRDDNQAHRLKVTEINAVLSTTQSAEAAHDDLEKALHWFFTNRGLILSVTRDSMKDDALAQAFKITETVKRVKPYLEIFTAEKKDYHDAAYWTKRFFEVVLRTQKKIDVTVLQLIGEDEAGRQAIIL